MDWQPIETAPKDREIDLWVVSANYEGRLAYCKWERVGGRRGDRYDWTHEGFALSSPADPARPTHWMEPPDAPPGREWYIKPEEDEAA